MAPQTHILPPTDLRLLEENRLVLPRQQEAKQRTWNGPWNDALCWAHQLLCLFKLPQDLQAFCIDAHSHPVAHLYQQSASIPHPLSPVRYLLGHSQGRHYIAPLDEGKSTEPWPSLFVVVTVLVGRHPSAATCLIAFINLLVVFFFYGTALSCSRTASKLGSHQHPRTCGVSYFQ